MAWAAFDLLLGGLKGSEVLNLLPALYLLFVICLVWSSIASSLLYLIDRELKARHAANRFGSTLDDPGIRFLPDDERPDRLAAASPDPITPARASRGGSVR